MSALSASTTSWAEVVAPSLRSRKTPPRAPPRRRPAGDVASVACDPCARAPGSGEDDRSRRARRGAPRRRSPRVARSSSAGDPDSATASRSGVASAPQPRPRNPRTASAGCAPPSTSPVADGSRPVPGVAGQSGVADGGSDEPDLRGPLSRGRGRHRGSRSLAAVSRDRTHAPPSRSLLRISAPVMPCCDGSPPLPIVASTAIGSTGTAPDTAIPRRRAGPFDRPDRLLESHRRGRPEREDIGAGTIAACPTARSPSTPRGPRAAFARRHERPRGSPCRRGPRGAARWSPSSGSSVGAT